MLGWGGDVQYMRIQILDIMRDDMHKGEFTLETHYSSTALTSEQEMINHSSSM